MIQWNPDITICQGSSRVLSLYWGIVISGFWPIHFTVTFARTMRIIFIVTSGISLYQGSLHRGSTKSLILTFFSLYCCASEDVFPLKELSCAGLHVLFDKKRQGQNREVLSQQALKNLIKGSYLWVFTVHKKLTCLKMGLNVPTLSYNICWSINIRAFSSHVCLTFFVGRMCSNKHGCQTLWHCRIKKYCITMLEHFLKPWLD